jgi:hypothetical protein
MPLEAWNWKGTAAGLVWLFLASDRSGHFTCWTRGIKLGFGFAIGGGGGGGGIR